MKPQTPQQFPPLELKARRTVATVVTAHDLHASPQPLRILA